MSPIDLWAAAAAIAAGSAIGIRARMLRPHHQAWTHAPTAVWLALSALALGLWMSACSILGGAHATQREAMIYTVLAVSSGVMLWNLNRNGRLAEVKRQEFAREAQMALEMSSEPARYPWERPS